MKTFAIVACCALTAVGAWLWVPEELIEDLTGDNTGISAQDELTWDQKNRRPTKSVFFCEVPDWVRGTGGKSERPTGGKSHVAGAPASSAPGSNAPISSGVQGNPFSD